MDKFDDKLFLVVEAAYREAMCYPIDRGKFGVCPFVFVLNIMLDSVHARIPAEGTPLFGDDSS